MLITKTSDAKFRRHLEEHPECHDKGRVRAWPRSLWTPGFMGGSGEVEPVGIVYCSEHEEPPKPGRYGEPIYTNEIMEVEGELKRIEPGATPE